jgi:hypothetical protein
VVCHTFAAWGYGCWAIPTKPWTDSERRWRWLERCLTPLASLGH